MSKMMQEADRSFVVVFDASGFQADQARTQVALVDTFVHELNRKLLELSALSPDAFSTLDGVAVSIGRNCTLNKDTARGFLDFVVAFVRQMRQAGLSVGAAVNYSERDTNLIVRYGKTMRGGYIHVGNAISAAYRLAAFAEIGEILLNKTAYDFLRTVGLLSDYDFIKNDSLTTKNGEVLETFSYKPRGEEIQHLYDPTCAEHQYKKYNYFPPIASDVVGFFTKIGLDYELNNVISSAFESIKAINSTRQFISHSTVISVLTELNYDPNDTVYVLNRQDRKATFWTQPAKNAYVRYLQAHASRNDGVLNQVRVRIYKTEEEMPDGDIYWDIVTLHKDKTYFSAPSDLLLRYKNLHELIFGATVSTEHMYAIIPIPSPESMDIKLPPISNIGDALALFQAYNPEYGPMKAIITADENYVRKLISEFEQIIKDPQARSFK